MHRIAAATFLGTTLALGCVDPPADDAERTVVVNTSSMAAENAGTGANASAMTTPARPAGAAGMTTPARRATPTPRPTMEPIPAPEDVAAPPAGAERTESGLASRVLQAGTGSAHPTARATVKVHYTGWTTDGQMFDSSVARGEQIEFPLNRVIPGWTEGVQLMVVGEKRRFWIPANLAYGETPRRPGAPAGQLTFDIELFEISEPPPPPETPEDVAAPPAGAERTESGIAHRVLQAGTGTEHPTANSTVRVHYTGWTTEGRMFDSSIVRGEPASFPLRGVIRGWTEGVQLMVVGEKRRFWIPGGLAYGDGPSRPGGPPTGTLVFDIELLDISGR